MINTLFSYTYTMLSKCEATPIEREKRNYFGRAFGAVEIYIKLFPEQKDDVLLRWEICRERFISDIFD